MSEERKPRKLSIIETMHRIGNLRVMKQREEDERKLVEYKKSDAHKTAEALAKLSKGQDALCEKQDALRQDFADIGDTMCEIVGKERIPPEREEIDDHSRRELYELVKRIKAKRTNKRGALDRFMDAATWRFRGFTVREIFKDTFTLNQFYNAERMKIARQPKRGNT